MPDDLTIRGPRDRKTINLRQAWEVRYWTTRLGVDADTLRAAVAAVGPRVEDVVLRLRSQSNRQELEMANDREKQEQEQKEQQRREQQERERQQREQGGGQQPDDNVGKQTPGSR